MHSCQSRDQNHPRCYNFRMLLDNVKAKLSDECQLKPGDPVVAAVSGGIDSMVLLHLLIHCGFKPVVAHFNHRIRPAAQADAEFVRNSADRYGLEFILGTDDVPALAKKNGETIEEAARNSRYRFLFKVAQDRKAAAVLTAHQADDQVETILMNILRGSGLNGLAGMRPRAISAYHPVIPLVRPLLSCSREEILQYSQVEKISFVEDESNQDAAYRRNRIRLELIPILEKYNPKIRQQLLRMAWLTAGDMDLLESVLRDALGACGLRSEEGYGEIDLNSFREFNPALQRRVVMHYLQVCFPQEKDLGSQQIEDCRRLLNREIRSLNMQLNDVILICIEEKKGKFLSAEHSRNGDPDWPYLEKDLEVTVQPGVSVLSSGWKIELNFLSKETCGENYRKNEDGFQAFLDAGRFSEKLNLRAWHRGDRYDPLGMKGKWVKVSDFWVNHKVPLRAKTHWPLVFSENRLIWIPGFQPSESARVTEQTREILFIKLFKA